MEKQLLWRYQLTVKCNGDRETAPPAAPVPEPSRDVRGEIPTAKKAQPGRRSEWANRE
jgi:hypothetical protein